jgi:hypothetical protein
VNYDFFPDPKMGWGDLALGGAEIVELPVNPHAMLETGDFSWAFWVIPGKTINSSLPKDMTIVRYSDDASTNDSVALFKGTDSENGFGSAGNMIFKVNISPTSASWAHIESNSTTWTSGHPYFIVVTVSHLDGLRMYVDGVLQTSVDRNPYTRGTIVSQHFNIGKQQPVYTPRPTFAGNMNGGIDHFRIYSRSLSLNEVKFLYGLGV